MVTRITIKTIKKKWKENNCMDISSDRLARLNPRRPEYNKEGKR